jgi:3-phenylpropionate/cinnamic acid dioxygenase small subunit
MSAIPTASEVLAEADVPEPTPLAGAELEAVASFVFHEAALLDARRYGEWLDLFADDGVYWLPQSRQGGDPEREVSIIYDDRGRIADRVARLESGDAFAQVPESDTCRVVGNVQATTIGELVTATANEIVVESRRNRQTIHAGQYQFDLVPDGSLWKIKAKIVRLVNADAPQGNLSLLL